MAENRPRWITSSFSLKAVNVSWQREKLATEPQEKDRLETMLVERVQSYLRVYEGEAEQAQLRSLCDVLAWLADYLLRAEEGWSRYYWVDAIRPSRASVLNSCELRVEGSMIWGERGQSNEWLEPLSATVRVSPTSKEVVSYQIMCRDAARGLKKEPYSMSPGRANRSGVAQWLFTFSEKQ